MRTSHLVLSTLALLSVASFTPVARAQRLNAPEPRASRTDGEPPPEEEVTPVAAGPALLQFTTDDPEVELRVPTGTHLEETQGITFRQVEYTRLVRKPTFEPACLGPCTLHVSPGSYRLALGKPDGDAVEGDARVDIDGPSRVHGELTDRSGFRTAGKIVAGVSAGTILALVVAAASTKNADTGEHLWEAAAATLGVGAVISVILLLQSDHAHFTVTPLLNATPGARDVREGMLPRGAAFTYVF